MSANPTEETPQVEQTEVTIEQQQQQQPLTAPPPAENDFSGSALPKVYDVKNLATPAPAEPMRFNTTWSLYADDHPTVFGSALSGAAPLDPNFVRDVADVESFWRLLRWLAMPSVCKPDFTYYWFRKDVKPVWEHPRNKNGGTITVTIFDRDKIGLNNKTAMDDALTIALLSCAGECFAEASIINGVVMKIRKNSPVILQFWTSSTDSNKLKTFSESVRKEISKVINVKHLQGLKFFSHSQMQQQNNQRRGKTVKAVPQFTF